MARDFEMDRKGMNAILRGREAQAVCMAVAESYVPRVAARTPRDTGETAATTHAEEDRMPDGAAGSKVVQSGAGVQNEFGNAHMHAVHHMTDALGNGG